MDHLAAVVGIAQGAVRTDLSCTGELRVRPPVPEYPSTHGGCLHPDGRDTEEVGRIGYISDQVPFWNNIHHWLDFLNHDTPVLTGTERLARSAGHAVFYIDVTRPRRGYYVAEFKLIARDPKQTKDYELTDAYFKLLEESIQRAPQYWLWTHNR